MTYLGHRPMTHFRSRLTGRASRAVLLGAASAVALTVASTGSALAQAECVLGVKPETGDITTEEGGEHSHPYKDTANIFFSLISTERLKRVERIRTTLKMW